MEFERVLLQTLPRQKNRRSKRRGADLDRRKQRLFVLLLASREGRAPRLAFCERERRGSEDDAQHDAAPVERSQRHGSFIGSRNRGGTSAARRLEKHYDQYECSCAQR